jgi:hypothetical protein
VKEDFNRDGENENIMPFPVYTKPYKDVDSQ